MDKLITDEQYFQLVEGLLDEKESNKLLAVIEKSPQLKAEWELWQMTVQTPVQDEEKFESKAALLAIAEPKIIKGYFWYRLSAVAAILLLGFVSFWMLSDVQKQVDPVASHIQENGSASTNSSVKESSIKKGQEDIVLEIEDVSGDDSKLIRSSMVGKPHGNKKSHLPSAQKEKTRKQSRQDTTSSPLSPEVSQVVIKDSTGQKPENILVNSTVEPKEIKAEIVYGTPVSKKDKRLRKLLGLKSKAKGELNKWTEKPQLGFAKTNSNKKSIELKNTKFKIGFRP